MRGQYARASTFAALSVLATAAVGQNSSSEPSWTATVHVVGMVEAYFNLTYIPDVGTQVQAYGLSNFTNTTLGSYAYHIHTNPVSDDETLVSTTRCAAALGHLDPLNVTENVVCDPLEPAFCQEGDLSGKHGKINATESGSVPDFEYVDNYVRWYPQAFSLLGRSIVIHGFNKTRLGCGNIISDVDFTQYGGESNYQTDYPTAAPAAPTTEVSLFSGTVSNAAASSFPAPLPAISSEPDVVLSLSSGVPVAVPATSTFAYSSGASLPSDQPLATQAVRRKAL